MRTSGSTGSLSKAPLRLKRRAEFLRVGKGRRWHGAAMTVQAEVCVNDTAESRFGFTLTKKVGNAVVRNRARRRLREAVRLAAADLSTKPPHDYVIVGRLEAVRVPFEALERELARGLVAVHERGRRRDKTRPQANPPDSSIAVDTPGRPTPESPRSTS